MPNSLVIPYQPQKQVTLNFPQFTFNSSVTQVFADSSRQMRVLCTFTVVLTIFCLVAVQGQSNNYLLQALDAAMAMKSNFDTQAVYYRDYVTYEKEAMARNSIELVLEAVAKTSTPEVGADIRFCTETTAYFASRASTPVLQHLEILQDAALVYYRIILDELSKMNVLEQDFELFYYHFNLRLNESYERLNDELLRNVVDNLVALVDESRRVVGTLDECLKVSWGQGKSGN